MSNRKKLLERKRALEKKINSSGQWTTSLSETYKELRQVNDLLKKMPAEKPRKAPRVVEPIEPEPEVAEEVLVD